MLRRTCHRRARTTVDACLSHLLVSRAQITREIILCIIQRPWVTITYVSSAALCYSGDRFVDGFRWNFLALSSTWPHYSSEYCKPYNNLWNTSYGENAGMMCLVSPGRRERVRVWWTYVAEDTWCGNLFQQQQSTTTIRCMWTNKQMYAHINTKY